MDVLKQLNETLDSFIGLNDDCDLLGEYLIWRGIKPGSHCETCNGTGYNSNHIDKCSKCGGSGSCINKWNQ